MRKIALIIPAIALALAACGQAAPSAAPPAPAAPTVAPPAATSAPAPTEPPAPTSAPAPTEGGVALPIPSGPGASIQPPAALVAAAQQRLAQHLGVPADTLTLQSANRQEWPNSALGCPEPDQLYLQVVTPGFVLIFSDAAQSQVYEVHTGRSEQQMVLCENNHPINLADQAGGASSTPADSAAPDDASRKLVELARQALAQDLGIDAAGVSLQRVEQTEWRDSSLGCPKPGESYLQVITPGYLITLEAQGRSYEYHTDTGSRVVRCDQSAATEIPGATAGQPTLANTSWKLEEFGDAGAPTPALANSAITMTFDGAKQMVSGSSGCNSYSGKYQADGAKITFSEIVSTLMACEPQALMAQEEQFQQALRAVERYKVEGDRLELTYAGSKVLRLRAIPAQS